MELTTLRIVYQPGFGTLPLRIAETEGFFEAHGLEVEVTLGGELTTYAAALGQQYDMTMTTAGVFLPGVSQLETIAVAGVNKSVRDIPQTTLVTNDPDVKSIQDLPGRTVSVPVLTGLVPNGIKYVLQESGLDPESVTFVQVPFETAPDQLRAGNVDVVTSTIPFYLPLLEEGGHIVVNDVMAEVANVATGVTEAASAFMISKRSFADENPDTIGAFQAAVSDAVDWVAANENAARAEAQEWLGLTAEIADAAVMPALTADITAEQLEPFILLLESLELIEPGLSAADLVWSR